PKLFQLTSAGKLNEGIFRGDTINTPSLLCVEDAIDSLRWAESVGGLAGLIRRTLANFAAIESWVENSAWVAFLAEDKAWRSPPSRAPTWRRCWGGSTGPMLRCGPRLDQVECIELGNAMIRVLIADDLSPRAAEILRARGIEAELRPGLSAADLEGCIGDYDGL